ncbi:hypothetical protein MPER_05533, partial [Moniliophthora perniciosa FA553]
MPRHEPLPTWTPERMEQEEMTHTIESDPTLRTIIQDSEDTDMSEGVEEPEMTEPGNITGSGGTQSNTGPAHGTGPTQTGAQQQGGTGGVDCGGSGTNSSDLARIQSSIFTKKKEPKVKAPPTFSGDGETTDDFLKAVKINLKMNKHMYDTDERKILYTLSYMNGGMAQAWNNNVLDEILDKVTKKMTTRR